MDDAIGRTPTGTGMGAGTPTGNDTSIGTATGIGGPRAIRQPARIASSMLVRALLPATRYVLRGGPDVMTAAGRALGLTLSQTACRAVTAASSGLAALWLGPDEQLLLGPETSDIGATLQPALRDLPHSLVDVGHRQTALEVRGPRAPELLNAGCPLDLDLSEFPVGMCTRTVLAKAEIVLWRTSQDVFHVEVWRSFADYVPRFLAEVAREIAT
jgi:sarcosine oxidase, subunit gamma